MFPDGFAGVVGRNTASARDLGDHGKNLPVFGNSLPFRTHHERPTMPQGLADRASIDPQTASVEENAPVPSGNKL